MKKRTTAEVVVIGGGVAGAAILWALAERYSGRVLLIEQQRAASGATGSSSAILRVHYTNPWESALALRSLEIFRNWDDLVGGRCGYTQTGFLRIVGPKDVQRLVQNVEILVSLGADVEVVRPVDLPRLQRGMSLDGIGAAAYEPLGGYANPNDTTISLLRSAVDHGARVSYGQQAKTILVRGDRIVGIETTTEEVGCDVAIVAAGAWTGPLLSSSGIDVHLRPRLIRAGFLRRKDGETHMTIMDDSIGTYIKPEGQTGTEFGLRYEWNVDPANAPFTAPLALVADGVAHLSARFPAMSEAGIVRGWGAVDSFSPDGAPLIGPVPGIRGLFIASGFSGTGFKIAPAVGLSTAALIDGRDTPVDISHFAVDRFAKGTPVASPLDYLRPMWRQDPA